MRKPNPTILIVAEVLSIIYSIPIFLLALATTMSWYFGFGDWSESNPGIQPSTIILGAIGSFYLIFPLWLLFKRKNKLLPKPIEYLIVLISFSPIIAYALLALVLISS